MLHRGLGHLPLNRRAQRQGLDWRQSSRILIGIAL